MDYSTVLYSVEAHVATVTLNRPEKLNSFNQQMMDEFADIWKTVKLDDDVHVVVIRASGDRAFCTGVDVGEGFFTPDNLWSQFDPGVYLGPRQNQVWKPVVAALHGMVAGGALYWVNESDIVICSDDATFFDPHVSYGLTAALEPIGLARRIGVGEALRMALLGLDERIGSETALRIGLVSEVLPDREAVWKRGQELADIIAAKPPIAIQGTVKAIWESLDMTRSQALQTGLMYTQIGNPIGSAQVDRASFARPKPTIR